MPNFLMTVLNNINLVMTLHDREEVRAGRSLSFAQILKRSLQKLSKMMHSTAQHKYVNTCTGFQMGNKGS